MQIEFSQKELVTLIETLKAWKRPIDYLKSDSSSKAFDTVKPLNPKELKALQRKIRAKLALARKAESE